MKRLLKFLLIGLLLVLLLVIGTAAWLLNDDALMQSEIERYASKALNRQLSMENLELNWGSVTRVRISNFRLANPAWASGPDFLSIEAIDAQIDIFKLLYRMLDIRDLTIRGATLALEEDANGRENWNFGAGSRDREPSAPGDSISWDHVQLSAFKLTHQSPNRETPLDFELSNLAANRAKEGRVDVNGKGVIGDYSLIIDGFIDPPRAFIFGGPVSAKLDIDLGEISFSATGSASNAQTGEGADFRGEFKGPDFAWLLKQAALPEFTSGPFDVKANLKMGSKGILAVDMDGDLGSLQTKLSGTLDRIRDPSEVNAKFDVSGPDLRTLGETFSVENLPASAYQAQGDVLYGAQGIEVSRLEARIGEDQIDVSGTIGDWPQLNGTALDVAASGSDISRWGPLMHFRQWAPNSFSVKGHVSEQGGQISIEKGQITVGESQLDLQGKLGTMPTLMGASLDLKLKAQELNALVRTKSSAPVPRFPIELTGTADRDEKGVLFKDMKLNYGGDGDTLGFSGLLAFGTSKGASTPETWQERFTGSYIKGELKSSNAGRTARSLNIPSIPDEQLTAGIDARLDGGQLTFSVAGANLGTVELDIEGNLDQLPQPELGQASFRIKLPSLKAVEAFTPARDLPDLPASVQGSLHRFPEGLRLENVRGTVGEGKFEVDGVMNLKPKFLIRALKFSANGADFRKFINEPWLEGLPSGFNLSGEIAADGTAQALKNLSITLGQTRLAVNGTINDFGDPADYSLDVSLSGPSLTDLSGFIERFETLPVPDQAFSLDCTVTSAAETLEFTDVKAMLGKSRLTSNVKLTLGEVPDIKATIESDFLDLSWLEQEAGEGAGGSPGEIVDDPAGFSDTKKKPSRIFSEEPLPILSWDPLTVDLGLRADTVQLPRTSVSKVQMGFTLSENQLRIDPVDFTSSNGGRFAGSVLLKEANGSVDAEVKGTADGLKLGLAASKKQDISTYPPWDYRVDLKASGNSMHGLAATTSGDVEVIVGQGQVGHNSLDLLFSDTLRELLSKLNPFAKQSDHTNLECGVGVVHFSEGIAQVDPIIYQTDKIVVTSKGEVNLATENINLSFNTRPRTGIGISPGIVINPFIKLGGTLAQPSITLDAPRAAVTGGAAVASGGLTLLGESLFNRFLRQRDPCGKVVKELRKMNEKAPTKS